MIKCWSVRFCILFCFHGLCHWESSQFKYIWIPVLPLRITGSLACLVWLNALIVLDAGAMSSEGSSIVFKSQKLKLQCDTKGILLFPVSFMFKITVKVLILLLLH